MNKKNIIKTGGAGLTLLQKIKNCKTETPAQWMERKEKEENNNSISSNIPVKITKKIGQAKKSQPDIEEVMIKIAIKTVTKVLTDAGADTSTIQLIQNNVSLYNNLLLDFEAGERHNAYLLYQLNNAIQKEIEAVKKHGNKPTNVDDDFNNFINKHKKVSTMN